MTTFESKYSEEQREAVAIAYVDRKVRPAGAVVALAARGELPGKDGPLEPFDIRADAVRTYASRLKRGRQGTLKSGLTDVPPRDAIESLRIRLVSAADHALTRVERRLRGPSCTTKDVELARQIARLIREAAAIPAKDDPRPVSPGAKIPGAGGASNGDTTRGGLGGQILASHRGARVHATDDDPRPDIGKDDHAGGEQSATPTTQDQQEATADDSPGAWMGEQAARLVPT